MQAPPDRRRSRRAYLLYGIGALIALTGGAILGHYTRGNLHHAPLQSASSPPPSEQPKEDVFAASGNAPLQRPQRGIRVEVLNGCGEEGVVEAFARRLRAEGFDVIKTGSARSYGYLECTVLDRAGRRERAEEVARVLRISAVLQQVKEDPFRIEDVTVIIGRNYRKLGWR